MPTKNKIYVPTEHEEGVALTKWCKLNNHVLVKFNNEGKRSFAMANYLKAEGLQAGFPDYLFPVVTRQYGALFIELKRTKGYTVSPEQQWWIDVLNARGYKAIVASGFSAAQTIILGYLEDNI